jgi:hypothetical protein
MRTTWPYAKLPVNDYITVCDSAPFRDMAFQAMIAGVTISDGWDLGKPTFDRWTTF